MYVQNNVGFWSKNIYFIKLFLKTKAYIIIFCSYIIYFIVLNVDNGYICTNQYNPFWESQVCFKLSHSYSARYSIFDGDWFSRRIGIYNNFYLNI